MEEEHIKQVVYFPPFKKGRTGAAGRGILDMFNALKIMKTEKLTAIPLNPPFIKGAKKRRYKL